MLYTSTPKTKTSPMVSSRASHAKKIRQIDRRTDIGSTLIGAGGILNTIVALPLLLGDKKVSKSDLNLTPAQLRTNAKLKRYASYALKAKLDTDMTGIQNAWAYPGPDNPFGKTTKVVSNPTNLFYAQGNAYNPWISAHESGHLRQFMNAHLQEQALAKRLPAKYKHLASIISPKSRVAMSHGLAAMGMPAAISLAQKGVEDKNKKMVYGAAGLATISGAPLLSSELGADIRGHRILRGLKIKPSMKNWGVKALATGTYLTGYGLPLVGAGLLVKAAKDQAKLDRTKVRKKKKK